MSQLPSDLIRSCIIGLLEFANLHSFGRALMQLEAIVPPKARLEIDY
jgi:hypothetical protein